MRRTCTGPALRPRKDSDRTGLMTPIPLGQNTPTSFRLARENDVDGSITEEPRSGGDSTYGVQSLQDTICEAESTLKDEEGHHEDSEDVHEARRRSTLRPMAHPRTRDTSRGSVEDPIPDTTDSSPAQAAQECPSAPSLSHSSRSLSLDSQAPLSSLPSTPKSMSNRSFRPSDEESPDEGGSQAIISSEEDEAEPPPDVQNSAPQLIMPSIKMPSRRPFTDRGKAMGRLKVLIAGDSGAGKTSLIKAIVQTCEDIVHVDPLSSSQPSINQSLSGNSKNHRESPNTQATQRITEVFASTKPYPSWWANIEDTKALRRRKSLGDTVLERNLCFVDSPGYNNGLSKMEVMKLVLQYIEAEFSKPFSTPTATEGDIAALLSGSGGSQVDVVFYLVTQELKDEDIEFIQRLTATTNVIPLIAQSDKQSFEETEMLRRSLDALQHDHIRFFTFRSESSTLAYTICSAAAEDNDTMDASTLMSPEYVQPLIPSELALLVQHVFDPENIACLRHLAAKKLVHAQGYRSLPMPTIVPRSASNSLSSGPIASPTPLTCSPGRSRTMVSYSRGLSPYVQAHLMDHTQQEETLAQIRLAKWAGDLQRSLENERARYEAVARGQRNAWLTDRLEETIKDGALMPIKTSDLIGPSDKETLLPSKQIASYRGLPDVGDPLGLLKWNDAMKRRGWIAFQVAGSFGVIGAMAIWVAKTWGAGSDGYASWTWGWLGNRM